MPIAPLLRLRLRWYPLSTTRLLLRRWQALVLTVGVLGAANASVLGNLDTFSRPLTMLLAPGHGAGWRLSYLLVLLALAVLWAWMQRAQIAGGGFMEFAGSLPFSARQRRRVDLVVLLLADSPLLLMVCAAVIVTAGRRAPAAQLLVLCDLAPLALVAQLAALERRPLAWAGVGAACVLLALGVGKGFGLAGGVIAGSAACLALAVVPWPSLRRRPAPAAAHAVARARARGAMRLLAGRHAPALRISLAILYGERRNEVLAKAVSAAAVIAAALGLMALFDYDGRSFPTVLLAQGAVALTLSGLYRGLHVAHVASAGFTGALPLAARWWIRFDLAALLGFGLPFLAAPTLAGWHAHAAPTGPLLAGLLSNAALLCALRPAQLISERHAVVLGAVLTAAWTAATIAGLTGD